MTDRKTKPSLLRRAYNRLGIQQPGWTMTNAELIAELRTGDRNRKRPIPERTDAQSDEPNLNAGLTGPERELLRGIRYCLWADDDEDNDEPEALQRIQVYGDQRAADAVRDERERLPQRVHPDSECTRDPIYLLQSRRWHCVNVDSYHWDSDGEAMFRTADDTEVDESYMRNSEDFTASWHVEGVWFTREEAECFGKSTYYRYDHGHRVYCVCAAGELAKLLRAVTTREPTP